MSDIIDINQIKEILEDFANKRDWDQFHNPKNLVMALAGETGELLEIFQWLSESEAAAVREPGKTKDHAAMEIADIVIYAIRLAAKLDINLSAAITDKIKMNNEKYPADKVRGSAKKHKEY